MPDQANPQDPFELAVQVDRLMRRMNAGIEARAPLFDTDRVGPIGGMILLTIAEVQPVLGIGFHLLIFFVLLFLKYQTCVP